MKTVEISVDGAQLQVDLDASGTPRRFELVSAGQEHGIPYGKSGQLFPVLCRLYELYSEIVEGPIEPQPTFSGQVRCKTCGPLGEPTWQDVETKNGTICVLKCDCSQLWPNADDEHVLSSNWMPRAWEVVL
jgi:hypothetical protein